MAQCGFAERATSIKSACFVVPPLFRADSGTNLIKQGENVKGRPCGSVAQLAECSHGKREALGSSPGRATIFSSPVTYTLLNGYNLPIKILLTKDGVHIPKHLHQYSMNIF